MLRISKSVTIPDAEITIQAIHAQGPGGQNVNKVATAIQLFFDIEASSLPIRSKQRLLAMKDQRINKEGVIIIKAQRFSSQDKNRDDALKRLAQLIQPTLITPKKRKPTKPTKASQKRRLDKKTKHSRNKALRKKVQ